MQGLPVGWYLAGARSPLEFASIFAGSWQFVCHVSDLPAPGTAARFDLGGRSAVVLRTRAGELRGYRNVCRHRGARLVEGDPSTGFAFCVDGRLRCPYHGWAYDDSGALADVPNGQDFEAFDPAAHALHAVDVAEWRGLVFVALQRPARALGDVLEAVASTWPAMAAMRRLSEPRVTALAADWKLACEHLLDTAHFDVARPLPKPRVFHPARFTWHDSDALHAKAGLAAGNGAGTWSSRMYRHLLRDSPPPSPSTEFVYVWPNLLLQLAPDGLAVTQVLPSEPGRCSYRESRYALPDASREVRMQRYAHERVRRQARAMDVRLLERVQLGFANLEADATGPIATAETGLRWFATRYRDHCGAAVLAVQPPASPRRSTRKPARPTEA